MAEKTPRLGWAGPAVGAAPGTLSPAIVTIWSRIGVARGIGVAEGRGVGFSTTVTWLGDGDGAGTDGLGFAGGAGSVWCGDGATTTVFGAGVVTLGSGTVTLGGVGLATTGAGGAAPPRGWSDLDLSADDEVLGTGDERTLRPGKESG